jgi:hypothetical protein
MTAGTGSFSFAGSPAVYGTAIPGGVEISGSLAQVASGLARAQYTPSGSSGTDTIYMTAHDTHGGAAGISIPVSIIPQGGGGAMG